MTDLIERLRARDTTASKYGGFNLINPDGPEAALEIQSLSERIAEQRGLLATAKSLIRLRYGNLDLDVNDFLDLIDTSLIKEG